MVGAGRFAPGYLRRGRDLVQPVTDRIAHVLCPRVRGGRSEIIVGLDGATLAPLGRLVIDVGPDGLGFESPALEIESDAPLVAESRFGFSEGNDLSYLVAVPVAGTVEAPSSVVGDLSEQTVVLGGD